MPITSIKNYYLSSSHLLYVSSFTARNDSAIINFDYNSIMILQDLEPHLHLTTLFPSGTLEEQRIQHLVIYTRS